MTGRGRALIAALIVFAVAVGVLIGSGPLRHAITSGSSDADDLSQAREEATAARDQAQLGQDFADAAGQAAVRGGLEGYTVALVRMADATPADVDAATARLATAGATVGASVALTDEWTSDDRAPFRDALADQLADALTSMPPGASTSEALSYALAQALVGGGEFDAVGQESADTLWTVLTEAHLVTGERSAPVNAVVVVSGGGDVSDVTGAFVAQTSGVVVAATGDDAGGVGSAASVTHAASFYGAWTVVGALIETVGGVSGTYDAADAPDVIARIGGDW